jgi:hypothetical protein
MFAFLALLFGLVVIYFFTSPSKEGFDSLSTPPSHKVNIPVNIIPPSVSPPPARNVDDSNVKPSDLPGKLPVAPYEQIASMSPLPYQDTTLIKANRQQLISMLELLKGFLAFEAQEIAERSDPTIQLPLNTARGDFHILQSQVEVLNRNPGLQPNITLSQLNEIGSNLAYLQREVRLIGAAGPIQGPIYEFTQPVNVVGGALEGFENMNGEQPAKGGKIATPKDLKDFIARISGEIVRLSASGTTDPVINARVVALTDMKANVQTILDQVQSGALMPVEIPIMKKDIENAFPILGKPSEPLPQIIKTMGLPPGLANVLPSNVQNDPNTTRQINSLIDKYADTIINGVSAKFEVKYTSPREAEVESAKAKSSIIGSDDNGFMALFDKDDGYSRAESSIDKTGFPSLIDLNNVTNSKFMPNGGEAPVTDRLAPLPQDAGRGPAQFDWQQRAKEIESQIKRRGLKPSDFGVMPDNTKVSADFSWKGYTRMICTRLQATMDPALPETCGCPPMDWPGWRIAK